MFARKFFLQLKFSVFLVPLDDVQQKISPSLYIHFQEGFQYIKRLYRVFIYVLGFYFLELFICCFLGMNCKAYG